MFHVEHRPTAQPVPPSLHPLQRCPSRRGLACAHDFESSRRCMHLFKAAACCGPVRVAVRGQRLEFGPSCAGFHAAVRGASRKLRLIHFKVHRPDFWARVFHVERGHRVPPRLEGLRHQRRPRPVVSRFSVATVACALPCFCVPPHGPRRGRSTWNRKPSIHQGHAHRIRSSPSCVAVLSSSSPPRTCSTWNTRWRFTRVSATRRLAGTRRGSHPDPRRSFRSRPSTDCATAPARSPRPPCVGPARTTLPGPARRTPGGGPRMELAALRVRAPP